MTIRKRMHLTLTNAGFTPVDNSPSDCQNYGRPDQGRLLVVQMGDQDDKYGSDDDWYAFYPVEADLVGPVAQGDGLASLHTWLQTQAQSSVT